MMGRNKVKHLDLKITKTIVSKPFFVDQTQAESSLLVIQIARYNIKEISYMEPSKLRVQAFQHIFFYLNNGHISRGLVNT